MKKLTNFDSISGVTSLTNDELMNTNGGGGNFLYEILVYMLYCDSLNYPAIDPSCP